MSFTSFALSDKGLKRKTNEDSFLINEKDNILLVADGMGGHEKGDIASKLVVETVNETISKHRLLKITNEKHLPNIIQEAINNSTEKISSYSKENSIDSKIGSTLVGIFKHKDIKNLCYFHLGDSRVYKIRNNSITQLTKDHTLYEEKKEENKLNEKELKNINKNQLTKAIGNFQAYKIDVAYTDLKEDDIFILCSDGVSNFIFEELLLRLVIKYPIEEIPQRVKDAVYKNGARDNLSLIITQYKI